MITLLQIVIAAFALLIAYEIGKYVGLRDAQRILRDK